MSQTNAPKLSSSFYDELLTTGAFSDIELDLGEDEIVKAHSTSLMPKSTWFAEQYPGKKRLKLKTPSDRIMEHF
ncbi:hypothetical protein BU25DRAFT_455040 [Macroventuria anomochaeta]|uniref:Uncharacterized protein n=1 Tax=Macroventuria anomochaeta TaxID=301207 RepID=A0ACB6SDN7_9PLEO|nr:uncharacterized protein BU25DRAFT_455040 [Macroventuria anomochaeta]KAF2631602.1 hypothetical protein BU25DRAFT_455040 [Macroventuria anomochaeta]